MVPSTRSRRKVADSANFLARKRNSFFKIIHSSIIQDQQFMIPRKFVSKLGKELSDVAVLKVPNGNVWHVRLRKANDEVWFHRGWQEFVEYHSIHAGHFLVFRYNGNSRFSVLIFDMSGNEIDYPSTFDHFEKPNRDGRKKKDIEEDSMETLDVSNDTDSLEELPTTVVDLPVQYNRKKHIKSTAVAVESNCLEREPSTQDLSKKHDGSVAVPEQESDSRAMSTQDKDSAIQAARKFKSENPFFMVIMRRTYVNGKFALNVPFQFMKTYFTKNPDNLTLRVSDGRSWPAQLFFYQGITKIYNGWAAFVKENNVVEGDVCVFELITKEEVALQVSIFSSCQRCGI